MPTLYRLLVDYEPDLLEVIASYWDVELSSELHTEQAEQLADAIAATDISTAIWQRLTEQEQQALLDLQHHSGQQTVAQFGRQYGEIRPMGAARRQRERPWLNPENVTEALYYRGLIARIFTRGPGGAQAMIAIPDELQELLPRPFLESRDMGFAAQLPEAYEAIVSVGPDDIATMLAWQMTFGEDSGDWLDVDEPADIDEFLQTNEEVATYRALLCTLALESELLIHGDPLNVNKDRARPWLEAPRPHQIRALAEEWLTSTLWNDLEHVPELQADVWPNDITLARNALLTALQGVAADTWWDTDSFVEAIKQDMPDFQRPGGDYTAWYIHDHETGSVLHGFEHWHDIEGRLIRYLLHKPMHWLALVELAEDCFRLTAYGEALIGRQTWPSQADPATQLSVTHDGKIRIDANMSRYHRLQIARFADWVSVPSTTSERYTYQLSATSLKRSARQNISAVNITAFLDKHTKQPIPESLRKALDRWQTRPNAVALRDLVIVTTSSREVFDIVRNHPSIKPLVEQRAGEFGFAVQRKHLAALRRGLWEVGVIPELEEGMS